MLDVKPLVLFLMLTGAGLPNEDSADHFAPQPESGGGLPLTLTVVNPSKVEATLFLVVSRRKMELQGVVHAGSAMTVTTLPRQKFVVFYPCRERQVAHKVPRLIADRWKLPARPCG